MDLQNAIFAPGWVWSLLSLVLVVGSLVGLYRQLRLQASQASFELLDRFHHEWTSERMVRHLLDVWVARRDLADPTAMPYAARYALSNFWEKVGALARAGHAQPKLLWELFGDEIGDCWAVLAPFIKATQTRKSDPSIFENFEWLAAAVARYFPAGAAILDQAHVRDEAPGRIQALQSIVDAEQSLQIGGIARQAGIP